MNDEPLIIETDLTDEEKAMVAQGLDDYAKGLCVPLDESVASMS